MGHVAYTYMELYGIAITHYIRCERERRALVAINITLNHEAECVCVGSVGVCVYCVVCDQRPVHMTYV